MALVASTPQLNQDGNNTAVLVSEKAITLSCGPVTFPDGTNLTPLNAPKSTYLIFRQLLGGSQEVLESQGKKWTAPSTTVAPQNLFWNEKLQAWQAIIVAIGNKDISGNPTFATDPLTGFPKYMAQCSFSALDSTGTQQDGLSPLSAHVTILAPGQNNVAGVAMDTNDPTTAKEIEIFLKDNAFIEQGRVVISQDTSGFHVQLIAGGASVVLSNNGQIVLSPSNSQSVQVNGDIAVSGRVFIAGIPVLAP